MPTYVNAYLKFVYSEKATKFCEIFTLLLSTVKFSFSEKAAKISEIVLMVLIRTIAHKNTAD